ncbi:sn-glycerol-3-phosphate ABC transporter ATP-binding protein UgpC [candidate division KSB3 bacterium]|jgi:multiple sugar transport system ATP-binding protein|uniref:Sn-glycerol-3-phosphate ABC transporter ATP-binding protein UgpC n=1 Tax=candidate division KSB3 bacterium TaxID=2044937 RepID=A0A9D5JXQ9_9BACT|nr:sn-glycerol-3-phosphate ABC transporter ATP-binding protein UgpC [candidate division KSB3 bacterium]MBD3325631.1 sn-glycerol-3-phosphate ABC transporter ATP-binding protein UgpC [candidate division KSB3 bacterium]
MADVILKDLVKRFPNGFQAVNSINLDIQDKEFIVLVGPSGCGKSTTLRMIAGLEEVTEGTISIGDRVVNDIAPKDRNIAMVFQNYALYPHMDVYTNMAFGLKLRKFPKSEIDERVKRAAEILGITQLLDRKPKQLSGGQRQRVAVGRAIVRDPQVFLFDEPLSNLDAKLRVTMRAELSKLQHQLETTMIYVTHDQVEAMTMGDRIVIMKDGYIQQVGSPLEVYDFPQNEFVAGFIGSPPMNFFRAKVAKDNGNLAVDTGSFKVAIPDDFASSYENYIGKDVTFGIRPEDIADEIPEERRGQWESFNAVVDVIEPLGAEVILELTSGDHTFLARVNPHTDASLNKEITVYLDMRKMHLFDPETEKVIVRKE